MSNELPLHQPCKATDRMQEKHFRKHVTDIEIDCMVIDLLFGIFIDWACISAGQESPWTRTARKNLSPENLQKILDDVEVTRMEDIIQGHKYNARNGYRIREGDSARDVSAIHDEFHDMLYGDRPQRRAAPQEEEFNNWRLDFKPCFIDPILRAADSKWIGFHKDLLWHQAEISVLSMAAPSVGANRGTLTAQTPGKALLESELHPSRIPLSSKPGHASVVFLSQLVPANSNSKDRALLLNLLRFKSPTCIAGDYAPLIQTNFSKLTANMDRASRLRAHKAQALSIFSPQTSPSQACKVGPQDVPPEVWKNISWHLDRRDIQSLLSTCKVINHRVGPSYFRHVVLPFAVDTFQGFHSKKTEHPNNDQKPTVASEKMPIAHETSDPHGSNKPRTELIEAKPAPFQTTSTKEVLTLSGKPSVVKVPGTKSEAALNMFRSWGSHISKFAFALEFNPDELLSAREVPTTLKFQSFYPVDINWHLKQYNANIKTQNLEAAAGQIEMMGQALSELTNVEELGLSIDGGLGWICGQDQSDRAKFFEEKVEIFGRRFDKSRAESAREWFDTNTELLSRFTGIERDMLEIYSSCIRLSYLENSNLLNTVADFMKKFPLNRLLHLEIYEIEDHVRNAMIAAGYLNVNQAVHLWDARELIPELAGRISSWFEKRNRKFWWKVGPRDSGTSRIHVPKTLNLYVPAAQPKNKERCKSFSWWTTTNHSKKATKMKINGNAANDPAGSGETASDRDNHLYSTPQTLHTFDRSFLQRLFTAERRGEPARIFNGLDMSSFVDEPRPTRLENGTVLEWERVVALVSNIGAEKMYGVWKPNKLTTAQRQCLKETSWVHQAFFTSYITSIIDHATNFSNVRTFTLAKLSSSYLVYLEDIKFWGALSNLSRVTIMVSPNWQEQKSNHDFSFPVTKVRPSEAASQLYEIILLLSKRPLVKTLKVGYIDGGEHATGLWARNVHLLPAPLTNDSSRGQIVLLPQLEDLTLVNCWIVSAVLTKFVRSMKERSLRTLTLDSVSLLLYGGNTQLISDYHGHGAPGYGIEHDIIEPAEMDREVVRPDPLYENGHPRPISLANQYLYMNTWPDLIDATDPAQTLELMMNHVEYLDELPEPPTGQLKRIEFISCGYAYLPRMQEFEAPYKIPEQVIDCPPLARRKEVMGQHVMSTRDWYLGVIVPYLSEQEQLLLEHALGMKLGWGDDTRRFHPMEDGWPMGGSGRFSGVLERETWMRAEV